MVISLGRQIKSFIIQSAVSALHWQWKGEEEVEKFNCTELTEFLIIEKRRRRVLE